MLEFKCLEHNWSEACSKEKFTHANNDVYEGEWKDDKASGFETYIQAKSQAKY